MFSQTREREVMIISIALDTITHPLRAREFGRTRERYNKCKLHRRWTGECETDVQWYRGLLVNQIFTTFHHTKRSVSTILTT